MPLSGAGSVFLFLRLSKLLLFWFLSLLLGGFNCWLAEAAAAWFELELGTGWRCSWLAVWGFELACWPAVAATGGVDFVRCNSTLNGIFGKWQLSKVKEFISFTLKPKICSKNS